MCRIWRTENLVLYHIPNHQLGLWFRIVQALLLPPVAVVACTKQWVAREYRCHINDGFKRLFGPDESPTRLCLAQNNLKCGISAPVSASGSFTSLLHGCARWPLHPIINPLAFVRNKTAPKRFLSWVRWICRWKVCLDILQRLSTLT